MQYRAMRSSTGKRPPPDPEGDAPPSKRAQPRRTESLHMSARSGDEPAVRRLVAEGHGVNDILCDHTPAGYAAAGGHLALVRYFAEEAGAVMECAGEYDESTLVAAARGGYLSIVRYLVEVACVDPHRSFYTMPVVAASASGHLDVLRYLVESVGSSVNVREDNMTALLFAVSHNHVDVVDCLIKAGADTSESESYGGKTAPLFAETPEMVRCLARNGVSFGKRIRFRDSDFHTECFNSLDCALFFGRTELARAIWKLDVPYPARATSKHAVLRKWARGEHSIQLEFFAVEKTLLSIRGDVQFPTDVVRFIGEFFVA
jgi:hypothetical protein